MQQLLAWQEAAPPLPLDVDVETDVETLYRRILAREAKIGVVGLGYVGLPLAMAAVANGFTAIGLDIDPEKIEWLNEGRSYIHHIPGDRIAAMVATGRFRAHMHVALVNDGPVTLVLDA